jgi:hypothetical protein
MSYRNDKGEKMRLKKKQLYPEIVKLDDGHEIVVVHDNEGRNLLMQTSVPERPLGYKLTPIDPGAPFSGYNK